jgi:hypothetical protein
MLHTAPSTIRLCYFEPTWQWTKDAIPDLSGKTIVITGANSDIGYETARICAEPGAHDSRLLR